MKRTETENLGKGSLVKPFIIIGLAIGAFYMGLAGFSASYLLDEDKQFNLELRLIEPIAGKDVCIFNYTEEAIGRDEFFIYQNISPRRIAVTIDQPPLDEPIVLVLGQTVDRAAMTVCNNGLLLTQLVSGNKYPYSQRPVTGSNIAFPVTPDQAVKTIILEVEQDAMVTVSASATRKSAYEETQDIKFKTQLFLYGAIGVMILYNTILGFLTKQAAFWFNAMVVSSMFLLDTTISGFGSAYLWPESPWAYEVALHLGLAGPSLFGAFFVYYFLREKPDGSMLHEPIFIFWPVASVITLASMFILPAWIVTGVQVILWISLVCLMVVLLVKNAIAGNDRAAILLIPLFGATIPPMFIGATKEYFGWEYGLIGQHHTQVSLVMEAMLFTFAVAYLMKLAEKRERIALLRINQLSNQTTRRLVEAIDEERTRISRELHDTAGQGFVLIAHRLARLVRHERISQTAQEEIFAAEYELREILSEIRQVSHDIHPPALDHLGLEKALHQLVENNTEGHVIDFDFKFSGEQSRLSKTRSLQVFRITQELVSNVLKHSSANQATVCVEIGEQACMLAVSDNGTWKEGSSSPGIGVSIIAQRVDILGGRYRAVTSMEGTTSEVRFPVSQSERKPEK